MTEQKSYNERLFKGSLVRSYFHLARFNWIKSTIQRYKLHYSRVIELDALMGNYLIFFLFLPNFIKVMMLIGKVV